MKFEDLPEEERYKHRIIFERGEETEAVGSAYREHVVELATAGKVGEIKDYELDFSEFTSDAEGRILTNNPETTAADLEEFHRRTAEAIVRIARKVEVPFESDDIARRIKLGEVAERLAGLIRGEFRADELAREIDKHGPALFTQNGGFPTLG